MHDKSPMEAIKVAMEKRVLNEFSAKILNEERLDKVVESRRSGRTSEHSEMIFTCECDDPKCVEKVTMSTEEYKHVHNKTKYFIVVPRHVQFDIEEVVERFNNYCLVAKFFPRKQAE